MLAVSQNFKDATESETRNIKARITMKGVTYTNSDIFNVEYNGGSITGETFNIGSTFSNNIKVTFSSIIEELLLDEQVKLEFGVVLSDSTIEYVKMGTFFITSYDPQRNDYKTVIEASDKMIQLNSIYKSKLTYPARIKDVAIEIANLAGVQVNTTSFSRINTSLISQIQGYTFRQAIGLIAQFECGYALFDRNGQLDIRMLSDPEYAVNPSVYFSKGLTKNEVKYTIGGISCTVVQKKDDSSETITLQSGSTSGAQVSLENNVMTQTLLDAMYQKIRTVNYFPFTLNWRGNPALEAGDWITVVDIRGNRFKVPNLNYKLSFSGGLKAVSSANTQTVSSSNFQYKGPLKQQLDELSGRIGAAGNHVYDGNYEPLSPKDGDLWFKPNGPDTEIWIYQNEKWVVQVSTAANPEIEEAIAQSKKDAEDAKKAANDAVDAANLAVDSANASVTAVQAAKIDIDKALNDSTSALDAIKVVDDRVDSVSTTIANVKIDVDNKADKTIVASQISQSATQVKQDVQSWTNGQLTNYSTTQQTANSITNAVADKADKSQITQLSDQIISSVSSVQNDLNNLTVGGENLLIDTDIGDLTKVNAPGNRYFSDAGNAIVTAIGFKQVSDSPTPSGYVVEATSIGGGSGGRRIAFYSGGVCPPFVKGETYTMSCYARKISGNPKIPFQYGNGTDGYNNKGVVDVDSTNWKQYSLTFIYDFDNPSITYLGGISGLTAGTLQSCGFKVERGNKATSWGFSQYELASKADKSQITQLSDQITSTVSNFKNNILDNSDFRNDFTRWNADANKFSSIVGVSTITGLPMKKPTKYIRFNYADLGGTAKWLNQTVNNPSLYAGSKLRMSVYYFGNNAPGDKSFEFYSRVIYNGTKSYFNNGTSKSYGKMTGDWNRIDYLVDLSSYDNPSLLTEININIMLEGAIHSTGWVALTSFMVTEDGNLYDWSYDYTASTSYSQITQLSDMINLRVSKGDVTSQINLEAGRTLIDTKQLLLNANTVKFSGSAFIPNAMIQTIAADKITAGTINAANVNIINLNAANITTGTLSGANLSMNLNTGAVQFQKGYIAGNNNKIRFDLDNNYFQSLNYLNQGFVVKDGIFNFYSSYMLNDGVKIGDISADILAKGSGIQVSGEDGVFLTVKKHIASIGIGTGGLANGNEVSIFGNTYFWDDLMVLGKKNAIHVTRDGVRETPAYETAESYLGDIGRNYTGEDCEIWVHIDELFSDTVNTDIAYEVFLQAYDNARFWVEDFRSDKFLVKSDNPMARFAWEIKAKRRGYENDRLVIQEGIDNKTLLEAQSKGIFKGDGENESTN